MYWHAHALTAVGSRSAHGDDPMYLPVAICVMHTTPGIISIGGGALPIADAACSIDPLGHVLLTAWLWSVKPISQRLHDPIASRVAPKA